jgi:alkyl hydroperoxide reductase subunit AhpC
VDELKPIFDAHEELVVVLSVSVDPNDTDDVLRLYREELGIEWVVAGDKNGVSKRYQVTSIPTLFIIDQQGVIRAKYVGVTPYETLLNIVGQLLG